MRLFLDVAVIPLRSRTGTNIDPPTRKADTFGVAVSVKEALQENAADNQDKAEDEDENDDDGKRRHRSHRSRKANIADFISGDNVDHKKLDAKLRANVKERLSKAKKLENQGKKSEACTIYRSLKNNDMLSDDEHDFVLDRIRSCPPPQTMKL